MTGFGLGSQGFTEKFSFSTFRDLAERCPSCERLREKMLETQAKLDAMEIRISLDNKIPDGELWFVSADGTQTLRFTGVSGGGK